MILIVSFKQPFNFDPRNPSSQIFISFKLSSVFFGFYWKRHITCCLEKWDVSLHDTLPPPFFLSECVQLRSSPDLVKKWLYSIFRLDNPTQPKIKATFASVCETVVLLLVSALSDAKLFQRLGSPSLCTFPQHTRFELLIALNRRAETSHLGLLKP